MPNQGENQGMLSILEDALVGAAERRRRVAEADAAHVDEFPALLGQVAEQAFDAGGVACCFFLMKYNAVFHEEISPLFILATSYREI